MQKTNNVIFLWESLCWLLIQLPFSRNFFFAYSQWFLRRPGVVRLFFESLVLHSTCNFEEIADHNTPNFSFFECPGYLDITLPLVRNSVEESKACMELECYHDNNVNSYWFNNLRQCLDRNNEFNVLNLHIYEVSTQAYLVDQSVLHLYLVSSNNIK